MNHDDYNLLSAKLHRKVLDRLDLEKFGPTASDAAKSDVRIQLRGGFSAPRDELSVSTSESTTSPVRLKIRR
jgi:hypothetical protein